MSITVARRSVPFRTAAAVAATLWATLASASPSWVAKGRKSDPYAEVASQARGGLLRFSCEETVKLYLYPSRGSDGAKFDKAVLAIDGEPIAMVVDAADKGVIFSDLPQEAVGTSAVFRARMKGGTSLVISGRPTPAIPPAQLTFPLGDAAKAIAAFERECPAAKASGAKGR